MCNYCEVIKKKIPEKNALRGLSILAERSSSDGERCAIISMLGSERYAKIQNGNVVYDSSVETPIVFLKSWSWDEKDPKVKQDSQVAVQINYCPICGEKF